MAKRQRNTPPERYANSKPEPPFWRWFFGHIFGVIRRHGNFGAGCVTFGFCFYEASLALRAFSGQISVANIQFGFLANVSFVWSVSLTVSGLSIGLYLRERKQHRDTRERLSRRITDLELAIDPSRESSKLTPRGETRREDE